MKATFITIVIALCFCVKSYSQDSIAFYNAKYNSTVLVPLNTYLFDMNVTLSKDTSFANKVLGHILNEAKAVKQKGDYVYLAPNFFVNVEGYDPRKHVVKMNNVMHDIFEKDKFRLLLNGKAYTMKSLEMEQAPLYCGQKRCGKKWTVVTKDSGTVAYEGVKRIRRNYTNPGTARSTTPVSF